ncbi:hypothetical protein [Salinispora arenicola]|uniref:hypothetical protein n=1 Tax=Salinispora arenicola TaxID=168697 RepID=UPI00039ADADD
MFTRTGWQDLPEAPWSARPWRRAFRQRPAPPSSLPAPRRTTGTSGPDQPNAIRFHEREGDHRITNFGPCRGESPPACHARELA